jgi:hypothetical protein
MKIIHTKPTSQSNSLFLRTTKMLYLDFIWLGVSGRLGASITEFYRNVTEIENFTTV